MAVTLCGHVVAPLDASLFIVVERGRNRGVVDWVAEVCQARNHISRVDGEAGAHVGSAYLGFA